MDISGLDLYHLTKELQELLGCKIQKAYGTEEFSLILDIYGFRKRYIFVDLPDILRFSDEKGIMPKKPPGFVERSRKHLQGLRIKSITQQGLDRILVIELEGRFYRKLIIELFAKGNLIICDETGRMLTVLRQETYSSRDIKSGKTYAFPPSSSEIKIDSFDAFAKSLVSYNENHALTVIAQLGFGGKYSQKIMSELFGNDFDRKLLVKSIKKDELELLYDKIRDYLDSTSFELKDDNLYVVLSDNENMRIVDILSVKKEKTETVLESSTKEGKKDKIVRMQKERSVKLSEEAEVMQKAGSILFERYEDLKKALEFAKLYKKKHGSLKGMKEAWPSNLPKLVKTSDDSRTIELEI